MQFDLPLALPYDALTAQAPRAKAPLRKLKADVLAYRAKVQLLGFHGESVLHCCTS
jgi:hypothetical protein